MTRFVENLGTEIPVSTQLQDHLLDPFHSPQKRGERFENWLQYIHKNAPFIVKKNPEALERLSAVCKHGVSPEEAFYFHYLCPHVSSVGFPQASISKIDRKNMYVPRREFRNEWWTLSGKFNDGFMAMHVWRHTDIPAILWDPIRDPKDYSYIKFSLTLWIDQECISYQSPIYCEGWHILELMDTPFGISYGKNAWIPENSKTIFPVNMNWDFDNHNMILHLDNVKPVYMMTSNGCVLCKDGIGLKNYTFPKIQAEGEFDGRPISFEGSFQHSWEAGVLPQGFSSSIILRSFINIEKSLFSQAEANISDWLFLNFHLDNDIQITCFCMQLKKTLFETFHPTVFTIVKPNGTIQSPDCTKIYLRIQLLSDNGHVQNIHMYELADQSPGFHMTFSVLPELVPEHDAPVIGYTHVAGWCNGVWKNEQVVTGFGFVQSSKNDNSLTEKLSSSKIQDFVQWAQTTDYFATTPSTSEVTNSWLLWFLPVIIIAFLICTILYVIWVRRRHTNKPWANTNQKHWFFK